MTKDEAKIVLLENLLQKTYHTIDFLDQCLAGEATYTYPEQTKQTLSSISNMITLLEACPHSVHHTECEACRQHAIYYAKLIDAKETYSD